LTVAVLVACHNRRELTVNAVSRALQLREPRLDLRIYVYDDGSTDGTGNAVRALGPEVQVVRGDGEAFWAKSMSVIERRALGHKFPDDGHLMWLNDDVDLDEQALTSLLDLSLARPEAIVVGATRDPATHACTYGGLQRLGPHPLSFARMELSSQIQRADTLNGNVVVVPATIARALGGIEHRFAHGMADVDYGLRARRAGISILIAPGSVGTCPRNPGPGSERFRESWRTFTGRKGPGNPRSLALLLRRASPLAWPAWWLLTYARWLQRQLRPHSR